MEDKLIKMLTKHEGLKLHPYRCTANKLTIGVGRNLDDKGIMHEEAMILLNNDIKYFTEKLSSYPWFCKLDDVRRLVIIDMAFNLGINGLLKFSNMISALEARDYGRAAKEMMDSEWAKQVKGRATELAEIMRTGEINDSDY